jgi:hypothetical protein
LNIATQAIFEVTVVLWRTLTHKHLNVIDRQVATVAVRNIAVKLNVLVDIAGHFGHLHKDVSPNVRSVSFARPQNSVVLVISDTQSETRLGWRVQLVPELLAKVLVIGGQYARFQNGSVQFLCGLSKEKILTILYLPFLKKKYGALRNLSINRINI